jgi:hypothetical protein
MGSGHHRFYATVVSVEIVCVDRPLVSERKKVGRTLFGHLVMAVKASERGRNARLLRGQKIED